MGILHNFYQPRLKLLQDYLRQHNLFKYFHISISIINRIFTFQLLIFSNRLIFLKPFRILIQRLYIIFNYRTLHHFNLNIMALNLQIILKVHQLRMGVILTYLLLNRNSFMGLFIILNDYVSVILIINGIQDFYI